MKKELWKYIKLVFGLALVSLGVVTILNSNFGLSAWDVLNQGINKTTGLSLGNSNTAVGILVLFLGFLIGQPIGSGTILNTILIGLFIDIFMKIGFLPKGDILFTKIILHFIGMVLFSYGCFLYISTGMGCGARDGMMVILTKKSKYSVGTIKICIEIIALIIGYLMGGFVGVGTLISAICIGPIIQFFFKIHKVDVKKLHHRSLKEEGVMLKNYCNR